MFILRFKKFHDSNGDDNDGYLELGLLWFVSVTAKFLVILTQTHH